VVVFFSACIGEGKHRIVTAFYTLPACDLIIELINGQYLCRNCLKTVTILFLLDGRAMGLLFEAEMNLNSH